MSSVFRGQQHQIQHRPHGMSTALLIEATKPFHTRLLDEAKSSLSSDQHEMAVVLSQAASEICTEWALTALLSMRNDKELAEPILDLFTVRNIFNEKLRRLYTALSGDNVQAEPFWRGLKSHHDRRNDVVHKGAKSTQEEAKESVEVVSQYILHVENVLAELQPQAP